MTLLIITLIENCIGSEKFLNFKLNVVYHKGEMDQLNLKVYFQFQAIIDKHKMDIQ